MNCIPKLHVATWLWAGGNPIKEILSLKKSTLVLNSLTLHYFKLDHNNTVL